MRISGGKVRCRQPITPSMIDQLKDLFGLKRHKAKTLEGLLVLGNTRLWSRQCDPARRRCALWRALNVARGE